MKVLGISPLDKDSTVTVVEDGVITYAAAEERFTRVKLQDGFPWRALEDALDRTGSKAEEFDRVVYPFLPFDEETRLFERNLAKERQFLTETETAETMQALEKAKTRVPSGRPPVPGLSDPNEKQEKGLLKNLAYRVLASEGVVSRNVAKRGSEQWGRDAAKFHFQWHQQLEAGLAEVGLGAKLKRVEHHVSACLECVLHQWFRPGADRHARRLRLRPGRQHQHRARRQDRARPRSRVSALARHVLRVGHVRARLQAQPARGQDRRSGCLRRSGSPRRHPA